VPSRLLQVPFGDDRAGAVIVPGEKLKLRGLQPPTYDQSGTSGRGTRLEVRPRGPGTSAHRTPRAPPTGSSQTLHKTFHRGLPKVGGKSIPMVDVSSAIPSCGRALPNALVEPDGLLRPLLRTPTPRRSGPREPGVAAASTARRGRIELRGACGRAACAAPRRSARRRLPSVTAEPRAPPRMRRCPSGRRPVERGGRDERLDGQGRVRGRKGRQGGGAHAADRPWRERQLAQS